MCEYFDILESFQLNMTMTPKGNMSCPATGDKHNVMQREGFLEWHGTRGCGNAYDVGNRLLGELKAQTLEL